MRKKLEQKVLDLVERKEPKLEMINGYRRDQIMVMLSSEVSRVKGTRKNYSKATQLMDPFFLITCPNELSEKQFEAKIKELVRVSCVFMKEQ